jgi:hypothetical protein
MLRRAGDDRGPQALRGSTVLHTTTHIPCPGAVWTPEFEEQFDEYWAARMKRLKEEEQADGPNSAA